MKFGGIPEEDDDSIVLFAEQVLLEGIIPHGEPRTRLLEVEVICHFLSLFQIAHLCNRTFILHNQVIIIQIKQYSINL